MSDRTRFRGVTALCSVLVLLLASAGATTLSARPDSAPPDTQPLVLLAAAGPEAPLATPLAPVHAQVKVKSKSGYNSDYIFGLSKGIADSTLVPALKAPIFILTVPLDLVFLPFAVIGGFFG